MEDCPQSFQERSRGLVQVQKGSVHTFEELLMYLRKIRQGTMEGLMTRFDFEAIKEAEEVIQLESER